MNLYPHYILLKTPKSIQKGHVVKHVLFIFHLYFINVSHAVSYDPRP